MTRFDNFRYQESRAPVPGVDCSRGWKYATPDAGAVCSHFRTILLPLPDYTAPETGVTYFLSH